MGNGEAGVSFFYRYESPTDYPRPEPVRQVTLPVILQNEKTINFITDKMTARKISRLYAGKTIMKIFVEKP
ncbi:MAG: hypothetical protein LBR26_01240 [Prevotella sp.]|nr:hypothetical protein [Prevotella sp.]